ncbi:MAG TPA: archaellin/type IV pilin N-terminal domain-containing protein [Dehalococcoidia bacterium]|nr:archaellin/type IV pilin N-terminal domain-containing protein [Dehalococcoidia bacterium]
MRTLRKLLGRVHDERGITGLETAIILIAFVVVAAVFAFVVLSTGLFSSERGKEAVYAGLAKTRGTMELSSGVVANSNGTNVTTVEFDMTLAAGGDSVNLDPTATSNRTVISYIDSSQVINDVVYTVTPISGNANTLLEPGELLRITIDLPAAGVTVGTNQTFTLEIKPPTGSYMVLQRTTPPAFLTVNELN